MLSPVTWIQVRQGLPLGTSGDLPCVVSPPGHGDTLGPVSLPSPSVTVPVHSLIGAGPQVPASLMVQPKGSAKSSKDGTPPPPQCRATSQEGGQLSHADPRSVPAHAVLLRPRHRPWGRRCV